MANFFSNTTGLHNVLDALQTKAAPTVHTSVCNAFPVATSHTLTPPEGYYYSQVNVAGDSNLTANNIRKGVTVFGVEGTFDSGSDFETYPNFTYTVNSISGAQYGFVLGDDGFYESQNKGVDSSYAICRVNFDIVKSCNISIEAYNLAAGERYWDYGIIGNLDMALSLDTNIDSSEKIKFNFYGADEDKYEIIYENVPTGVHYIDIKFRKDSSYSYGEDTFKFKIIDSYSLNQDTLTQLVQADQDLKPENIRKGVNILGIEGTYGAITEDIDAIFNRSLSGSYVNSTIIAIPSGAFCGCDNLVSATFTRASQVNRLAFYNCSKLSYVSFPMCKSIGYAAFSNCYNLMSAYFSICNDVGEQAFAWAGLKTLSFPSARNVGYYAFAGNPMSSVSMWQVYSIHSMAFAYCSSLAQASFQWCKSIGSSAFLRCSRLSVLRLMSSSVCSLVNSNAFSSTPFAGYSTYFSGTPSIYVPSSLLASYKAATNWSYYSEYFVGV